MVSNVESYVNTSRGLCPEAILAQVRSLLQCAEEIMQREIGWEMNGYSTHLLLSQHAIGSCLCAGILPQSGYVNVVYIMMTPIFDAQSMQKE